MILNFLTQNREHLLRIVIGQGVQIVNNPMPFYFSNRQVPSKHLYVTPNNQGNVTWISDAYCLPWNADTGLYVDLPVIDPTADLFLTSQLTGCHIGVQRQNGMVRIRHYNGDLTEDDLRRYGNIAWLTYQPHGLTNVGSHVHFYQNPTCFWGEFEGGAWQFYYQTTDGVIHPFHY